MHRALKTYAAGRNPETELLTRYATLLDRHARRLALRTGTHASVDDFWNAGAIGLLEASRRFDAASGVPFEAFVEHRVRGAMLDELRRMDHLPRRLRAQTDSLQKARKKLGQELGREASLDELAAELKLDISDVSELDALPHPMVEVEVDLPQTEENPIDEQIDRTQTLARLTEGITTLSERLQLVMSLVYVEGLTYKEVASILKVTEARICQLHRDAVLKLRAFMNDQEPADATTVI